MRALLLVVSATSVLAYVTPLCKRPLGRAPLMQQGRDADDVGGAIGNTFSDIFSSMFKRSAEKEAEIDRAYREQLEVAERRRNPERYRAKIRQTEERRARASRAYEEKFAWQRSKDPLAEFKKRQKQGKVAPLGYEEVPKGGIQLPSASFGVGGEFGVGGKYDNGERFDLRLPFAEQGWVDEASAPKRKSYTKKSAQAQPPNSNWWEAFQPKPAAAKKPSPKASRKTGKAAPPPPSNPLEWWIQQSTK